MPLTIDQMQAQAKTAPKSQADYRPNPAAVAFAGIDSFVPPPGIHAVADPPPIATLAPTSKGPRQEAVQTGGDVDEGASQAMPPPSAAGDGWGAMKQTPGSGVLGQRLGSPALSALASTRFY